jgi:transcription initiation factor TFIIIB Brf1 subunit/transcription initiation factor TFIIB
MSENETIRRRRARRPTEAAARLERVRRRNAEQLEAQREAERRIETALTAYVDAEVSIHAVEHDRDDKLAILERQIEQAHTTAQVKIEEIQAQQAIAVWHINDAGRTVEQIAELLEVPHKEARRLLHAGRTAANSDATTTEPTDPHQPTEQPAQTVQASVEQRHLSGIDGHQDPADARLVPPVADGGGQRS